MEAAKLGRAAAVWIRLNMLLIHFSLSPPLHPFNTVAKRGKRYGCFGGGEKCTQIGGRFRANTRGWFRLIRGYPEEEDQSECECVCVFSVECRCQMSSYRVGNYVVKLFLVERTLCENFQNWVVSWRANYPEIVNEIYIIVGNCVCVGIYIIINLCDEISWKQRPIIVIIRKITAETGTVKTIFT